MSIDWRERLEEDAKPLQLPVWRVKGTKVEVNDVLALLQRGWTAERIAREMPPIREEDVDACLQYAIEAVESAKLRAFLKKGDDDIKAGRVVEDAEVWRQFEEKFGPLDDEDDP